MEYEQGSSQSFYATFVNHDGEAAIVSGIPTISIQHYQGNVVVSDVISQDMNLRSGTEYYYNWNIPAASDLTTYYTTYSAVFSGVSISKRIDVLGSFDFQVIPRQFYKRRGGGIVNRIAKELIWTIKEKEEVLNKIEEIFEKLKFIQKGVTGVKIKLSEDINKIKIKDYTEDLERVKDSLSIMSKDLSVVSSFGSKIEEVEGKIEKISNLIRSKPDPKEIDIGRLDKSLLDLKEELNILKPISEKLNRLSGIRLELADMSDKLDEIESIKQLYLKTLPSEKLVKALGTKKLKGVIDGC